MVARGIYARLRDRDAERPATPSVAPDLPRRWWRASWLQGLRERAARTYPMTMDPNLAKEAIEASDVATRRIRRDFVLARPLTAIAAAGRQWQKECRTCFSRTKAMQRVGP
jgi:hypothetical protein